MAPGKKSVGARKNNDKIKKATKYRSGRKKHLIFHFAKTIINDLELLLTKPFLTSAWGKRHYNTFKAFQSHNRNE